MNAQSAKHLKVGLHAGAIVLHPDAATSAPAFVAGAHLTFRL